ncbi:MAG: tRNA 2-thiouridine(34) synthase MnmA [Legionellales bacterium]|nr:tRNA 2-thiouridine(34) synthase MnmA [Legionellales bacterium]
MKNTSSTKNRVIVGMSGGVDSSVSALRLLEQGWQVEGLFMKNWDEDDNEEYCTAAQDLADAQAVSDKLGIVLHTVNFAREYWDNVFENFLATYAAGRTPNPDILCNKEIKFKAFLDYAISLGADKIATGHYAQNNRHIENWQLLKGNDPEKDQSYFLYTLGQEQLAKSLFPIGDLPKQEVRQMAARAGLITHNKKDSTGICFIGERRFKDFLSRYLPAQPGNIETIDGHVIGHHEGLMYYTIGQRKGIGIGGLKNTPEQPWYVVKKDLSRNTLIIGQDVDRLLLYTTRLVCTDLTWVAGHFPDNNFACTAKTRYRQTDQSCQVQLSDNNTNAAVLFEQPQRAVTPGQSVVFYHGNICLGGGIIESNE